MKDCIEAKLFGIGLESYTVGSYDFYLGYGAKKEQDRYLGHWPFPFDGKYRRQGFSLLLFAGDHVARKSSDPLG